MSKRYVSVPIVLDEGVECPQYMTEGSAGFDIATNEKVVLHPNVTKLVSTGIRMAIPKGYELQLRPRSGLSLRTDLVIKNSPATIDSDFTGEIKIILKNNGGCKSETLIFEKGERICQGVIAPVVQGSFKIVDKLESTDRGEGGFGHTGK